MNTSIAYSKDEILAAALNENFDAAARSSFQISTSNGDLDYAHIIDEEIDGLEDVDEPQEFVFTKGDFSNGNVNLSSFRPQKELNPKIWIK